MLEKIDWDVLNEYIEKNLIIANKHPEYDIWILSYSPKAFSKQIWDEYTTTCNSLVIDIDGRILARPFKKFINYEDVDSSEINMAQNYSVFEKYDGSLIVLFYHAKRMIWIVGCDCSFITNQSFDAKNMLSTKSGLLENLDKSKTYLIEYISHENRGVVDYGDLRDLILLGEISTTTGVETPYNLLVKNHSKYFTIAKKENIIMSCLSDLKLLEEDNKEGFVVLFEDGLRVSVKFDEYLRLCKILTNTTNLTIWEHLMNKYDFDALLNRVPDDFYDWLTLTIKSFDSDFNNIERLALKEFIRIYHINNMTSRDKFALEAVKTNHFLILYQIYNKKPYDEIIWKLIRPTLSLPFRRKSKNSDFIET